MTFEVIIKIILCYLLGSISGSLIIGKIKNVDIRKLGSGNAGATNAFRTQGLLFSLMVMIIDVAKGYFSVSIIANDLDIVQILLCGIAAVLGHVYPIYYNFKGGKGAGTLIGVLLALFPTYFFIILLMVWIIIIILSGYVGLSTMVAGVTFPILLYYTQSISLDDPKFIFSIAIALFLIFTHRQNISRMIKGDENQFKKAMLIHKLINRP
tara:strand:- start:80 stop:709 length:630 start_codon:yes stop_codon:yes gene_type:complete